MRNPPEIGATVTIEAIMGEPSPYWVELYTGRVVDIDGDTVTVETQDGERRSDELGSCKSWTDA